MNILMVAAEMSPLVKVGGLADVVGALPAALARLGCQVRVVLPLYGHLDRTALALCPQPGSAAIPLRVGQQMMDLSFWRWLDAPEGVTVDLVRCPPLFDRPGVYHDADGAFFGDTIARASALCQAALLLPQVCDWPADVVHAHDVQAALAPVYRHGWYAGRDLPGRGGTLLTIHNLAHQEIHPPEQIAQAGLPLALATFPGPFEFYGKLNLLKAGIVASELVNTVSPTYARQVVSDTTAGCGLEGVLAARGSDFSGILNGVDDTVWDPAVDPFLATPYTVDDLTGKARCRDRLLALAGLEPGPRPLLGLVGRLVAQKGLDLVMPLLDRLVAGGFSLVVLGTGASTYEAALTQAGERHPGRIAFWREFSEAKAHLIYAGCDLFLMPSRFEPCGLGQLYALRYGTPPVVRRTGGLADTVSDHADDAGTGFVFDAEQPEALWSALERAREVFAAPAGWRALQRRAMACNFSWDATAARYLQLYQELAAPLATNRSRS